MQSTELRANSVADEAEVPESIEIRMLDRLETTLPTNSAG